MRCLECGHSNPESNKFCGECGARLEMRAAKMRDVAPSGDSSELERRDTERERVRDSGGHVIKAEPVLLSSVVLKTDFPPATPEEEAEEEKADIGANVMPKQRVRVAGISGPSILGLGYETAANPEGFVYDKPRRDGFIYDTDGSSPEYLLDERPGRSVSWRAWALLLVLAIAGGLGYLQWRANRGENPDLMSMVRSYASTAAAKLSAAKNGSTAPTNPASATTNPTGAPSSSANAQAPSAANTQQTDSQTAAQNNAGSASTTAPQQSSDNQPSSATLSSDSEGEEDQQNDAGSAPSATSKQPSAPAAASQPKQTSQPYEEDNSATPPTQKDDDANPESDQPARSTAKPARPKAASLEANPAAATKPKPLGDKDPLIVQAESYIQGRGRPKNCSAAVNLLRQSVSQGNPAADVKLGALYWSGTCVTQSKVTAYQWFSRAHTLEPTNRWIERSRNSMWASMNEQEKRLAVY